MTETGTIAWGELIAADGSQADSFYRDLFGYDVTQIGDGEHYDYTVWAADGVPTAGRLASADNPAGPGWLVYLTVDPAVGTDAVVEQAVKLGATELSAPQDIPAGRVATLRDPQGAVFAVLDRSKATQ